MTIWKKYHSVLYVGTFVVFLGFCISLSLGLQVVSILVLICGICIVVNYVMKIKCPKCNTPLQSGHSLFSGHYDGFHFFLSKKCLKCGASLDGIEGINEKTY
jgi:hypothetical protein